MEIENKFEKIIPSKDYKHRNGFNNNNIVDNLSQSEKKELEDWLIEKLLIDRELDTLIVETLAYLKSNKALPILNNLLKTSSNEMVKLIISTSIFEISHDNMMVSIAISSLKNIDNINDSYYVFKITSAFYYLIKFNSVDVNNIIREYTHHKEYLISYNAQRALRLSLEI